MKKTKKKLVEAGADFLNSPDSLWNRISSKKKAKSGKTIQQILGVEDAGPEPLGGRRTMRMMDIIKSPDEMYEKEENNKGEDDDEKNE